MSLDWLQIAKQIQALAQAGLTFSENEYDTDRYQQLRDLSIDIIRQKTAIEVSKIRIEFASEKGYQTPKVDVRAVIFRANKILMVREKIDGKWSLPGGWCDIGFSPFENAVKETFEETGLNVEPLRLLALLDKKFHNHPPDLYHTYKIFVLCRDSGEQLNHGFEILEAAFFSIDSIPSLSEPRNTIDQIKLMFEYLNNPLKETICE